ncbi:MAG TPA: DUF2203 domain-containing protein [Actinomycetota bacterium]|nr:DUF2203 domain-containing protein [Actinomycetota bacterium]
MTREGERRFTVEEANAELEELRTALARIREARQVILRSGERIRSAAPSDGGGEDAGPYLDALTTLRREMERITERGIVVRDAESGLVDFPAEREGRAVFLCWRLGEEAVAWWHPPETGFPGRRPL